ncbi:alpha/beta hydrolase [Ancylobacter polymorphus]|uniref:Alpha/beta hydrolase n=1 Tax=Ancylobacter polymorphus TaxID=223390 RepID=A0A9E7A4E7_9HYPH|nr:alpha/beta hydrolase [Ancylobacter polymorphus]UOK72523.1 alpha/beta hydrolase [Ancylobacter polymorphus]
MKGSQHAIATVIAWLSFAMPCAAQTPAIIGFGPAGEPICGGTFGPVLCSPSEQDVSQRPTTDPFISAQSLAFTEALLRHTTTTSTDAKLKSLGRPVRVAFSAAVASQGLILVNARVFHDGGVSEWRLGLLPDGSIASQELIDTRPSSLTSRLDSSNGRTSGFYEWDRATKQNWWSDYAGISPDLLNQGHLRADVPNEDFIDPLKINPLQPAQAVDLAPPPPLVDARVVEFLIATTRQEVKPTDTAIASYSGNRAGLSYGIASVRIPEDHKIGHIELPASWSLFGITFGFTPNDNKHFVIKRVIPVNEELFGNIIRSHHSRTALIFVHGFNTSFEESAFRNAQIIWDLQFTGISVLFSWASRGETTDYLYDKESAALARSAFLELIEKLNREYGVEQINVLAHSMGNLLTLDALAGYAQTTNPIGIARLVMAAPDVDRDVFLDLAPKAKAIVGGMTLYASAADRALAVSRGLAGGVPRAGDVPTTGPVLVPGIETIDVTAVGSDILGLNHNAFAASRAVLEDIGSMMRLNQPPPRLVQIRAVPEPPSPVQYWRYAP